MSSSKSLNEILRVTEKIEEHKNGKESHMSYYLGRLTEEGACKVKSKLDDYSVYLYHRIPKVNNLAADKIPGSIPLFMIASENRLLMHPHYAGKKTEKEMSALDNSLIQLYHRIPSPEEISVDSIPESIPLLMVATFGQESALERLDKS